MDYPTYRQLARRAEGMATFTLRFERPVAGLGAEYREVQVRCLRDNVAAIAEAVSKKHERLCDHWEAAR